MATAGVATAFDGFRLFSTPYRSLPIVRCTTNATRRSQMVPVAWLYFALRRARRLRLASLPPALSYFARHTKSVGKNLPLPLRNQPRLGCRRRALGQLGGGHASISCGAWLFRPLFFGPAAVACPPARPVKGSEWQRTESRFGGRSHTTAGVSLR